MAEGDQRTCRQRRNLVARRLAIIFTLYSLVQSIITSKRWSLATISSKNTVLKSNKNFSSSISKNATHEEHVPTVEPHAVSSVVSSSATPDVEAMRRTVLRETASAPNVTDERAPALEMEPQLEISASDATDVTSSNATEEEAEEPSATTSPDVPPTNDTTIMLRDHPHAGARDENGDWNYVPDVSVMRRNVLQQLGGDPDDDSAVNLFFPLEPELLDPVCQVAPGLGFEGHAGYQLLRHHVQLNGPDPVPDDETMWSNQTNATSLETDATTIDSPVVTTRSFAADGGPPARILCAVYTFDKYHDRIRAIADTWGWRCDGFFAASNKTDANMSAIDLPHQGEEKYDNMWQKTRSILGFMHDHYLDEYDYFFLSGDDTYLIAENLRSYLHLLEASEGGRDARPLYIGSQVPAFHFVFNVGGPGYVLNRHALRQFVEKALPTCWAHLESSAEDRFVGRCLHDMIGITAVDTADVAHRQRFFGMDPNWVATKKMPGLAFYRTMYEHWAKDHGWRSGMDVVSTQSVSFHWLRGPERIKRVHAILYNSCPVGTVLRDAQNSTRESR